MSMETGTESWITLLEDFGYDPDEMPTTEPPYHVPRQAYFVMSGIVINMGLIFNTLSFIVIISSSKLRETSSGMFLIALSVADSVFLFGDLLRWINNGYKPFGIEIHFMDMNDFACRMIHFLRYGGKLTSAWLTVAITTERLLLVACPLKHPRISSPRRTRVTIGLMFVVCFLFGSFPWWSVGIQIANMEIACGISDALWYEIGNWVSLRVGSLLLPGVIVCIMTGIIIHYMTYAQKKRNRKLSARRLQRQDTFEVNRMSIEKQLTMMLIAVAVAFIILRLPYTITYYLNKYKFTIWPGQSKWFYFRMFAANQIADTLATLNYAINFFLYYICGKEFRKQLKLVCTCAICKSRAVKRQSSWSSSFRMTTVNNYSRSLSGGGRPDSPRPSIKSDKNSVFV